jgi:hypothetical protein
MLDKERFSHYNVYCFEFIRMQPACNTKGKKWIGRNPKAKIRPIAILSIISNPHGNTTYTFSLRVYKNSGFEDIFFY